MLYKAYLEKAEGTLASKINRRQQRLQCRANLSLVSCSWLSLSTSGMKLVTVDAALLGE